MTWVDLCRHTLALSGFAEAAGKDAFSNMGSLRAELEWLGVPDEHAELDGLDDMFTIQSLPKSHSLLSSATRTVPMRRKDPSKNDEEHSDDELVSGVHF